MASVIGVDRREGVGDVDVVEQVGQLDGDHPVRPRRPGHRHLLTDGRDATLEVGRRARLLAVRGGGEHDVGGGGGVGQERVDGDHPPGAGERPPGQLGVGEVAERVGPEEHEEVEVTVGGGREDAGGVEAVARRAQAELQGADDVAAAQRREHLGAGAGVEHGAQGGGGGVGRLGEVGPSGDDDDRSGAQLVGDLVVGEGGRRSARRHPPRPVTVRHACAVSPVAAGVSSRILTLRCSAAWRSRRCRTGSSSLRSGASSTTVVAAVGLVDRRARQRQQAGGEPVAELGVAVGHAEGIGEGRPRVGVLVGAASPAEDGDAAGPTAVQRLPDELGGGVHGDAPRRLGEPALTADVRHEQPVVGTGRLEVEATAVAQPAPVDRVASRRRGSAPAGRATTARRCGTRRCRSCTCSRPARGPTAGP